MRDSYGGRALVLLLAIGAAACDSSTLSPVAVDPPIAPESAARNQVVSTETASHRSINTLFGDIAAALPTFGGVYVSSPGVLSARFTGQNSSG